MFARSLLTLAITAIALFLRLGPLRAAEVGFGKGVHGETLTQSQVDGLTVSRAPLKYPIEARRAGISGRGVFEMRIDPRTGRVKGVRVVQSTGSQMLDWTVVYSFNRWRFKPGVIVAAWAPVKFSLSRLW